MSEVVIVVVLAAIIEALTIVVVGGYIFADILRHGWRNDR